MNIVRRVWRWLDDLTGVSSVRRVTIDHPVPPGTGWYYVFGSATLIIFLAQVATGVALSSAYVSSSGEAYQSLRAITSSPLGRMMRGMHAFGASAMVILIGLHTARVYLTGSYKFPRQANWLSGAVLLPATLLMAFTGQLLRWDQTGFWTAVVAAEQGSKVPVIGGWIAHLMLGGSTAGGATLSRFFAGHVFFLPAVIFPFIGIHLYLVLRNGISEPPRRGHPVDPVRYRAWYHRLLAERGHPFWPGDAWRDAVFGALVLLVVAALALTMGPPELGRLPDPTILDASPRPDWYFLWYFALLTEIPKWLEDWVIVLGPLAFGGMMILLPLAAPYGERHPLRRPWSIVLIALVVTVIAAFGALGHQAPWSPRLHAKPLPAAVIGAQSGPVAQGARLFFDKGCEYCHRIAGEGGIRGPDLDQVGRRLTRAQMETRVLAGGRNMPAYSRTLAEPDLQRLLDFLQSRGGPGDQRSLRGL